MASKIKGITIEIGGDTTGLDKALSGVNKQLGSTRSELRTIEKQLKLDPTNTVLLAQKQEVLGDAISKTSEKLKALEDVQSQVEAQYKRKDIDGGAYREFQREIEKTKSQLNELKNQKSATAELSDGADEAKSSFQKLRSTLDGVKVDLDAVINKSGKALATAGKVGLKTVGTATKAAAKGFETYVGALGAAATATAGFSAAVVNSYAELEQNLGGSEAVFGEYAENIQKSGEQAYKNLGLSQSEYLATANKMGALFQGSGIEQQRSLDLTTEAMQRAADMASVMGIDTNDAMEAIAGAAKGNYTMMDNLGVSMNNTTLEAYRLEKGFDTAFSQMSNAEKAEVAMQYFFENTQQYAGNFAKEATGSISGSIGMLKPAVSSLMAGLGNADADVETLAQNVLDAFESVVKNVEPILENLGEVFTNNFDKIAEFGADIFENILNGITKNLPTFTSGFNTVLLRVINTVSASLPTVINTILPQLLTSFTSLVQNLAAQIPTIVPMLVEGGVTLFSGLLDSLNQVMETLLPKLPEMVETICNTLSENLPTIIEGGFTLLVGLLQGMAENTDQIVSTVTDLIPVFVNTIIENLPLITDAGFQILSGIVSGVCDNFPDIVQAAADLIAAMLAEIALHLPDILAMGLDIVVALADGLVQVLSPISDALSDIMISITDWFSQKWEDFKEIGANIISGIGNGIKDGVSDIWDDITGACDEIYNEFCDFWGIHSPSRKMAGAGGFMAQGIGVGFADEIDDVNAQMQKGVQSEFNVHTSLSDVSHGAVGSPATSVQLFNGVIPDKWEINLSFSDTDTFARAVFNPLDVLMGNKVQLDDRGLA